MENERLARIESKLSVITAALLGHEGNAEEGVLAISRKNERQIAEVRTTLRTLWAVIIAIPVLGAALAYFVPLHEMYKDDRDTYR